MVRTGGSHPPNRGSIPRSATKQKYSIFDGVFLFVPSEVEGHTTEIIVPDTFSLPSEKCYNKSNLE